MKKELSICMIVGKEEANIKRCLDSFAAIIHEPWCELIVVVTKDGDRTQEVAESYTDKVYFQPWQNDFSFHRNFAISHATGHFIMTVDADEELPQQHLYWLQDLVLNPDNRNMKTIFLTIRSFHDKGRMQWSEILQPRIFANEGQKIYAGTVHNRPECREPFWFVSEIWLNHYGYIWDGNPELLEQKTLRSLPLLEKEYADNPGDLHILTHLVKTFYTAKDFDNVMKYGNEWMALMSGVLERGEYNQGWYSFLEVFVQMLTCYLLRGDETKALEIVAEIERYTKRLMVAYFLVGNYYIKQDRNAEGVEWLEKGVAIAQESGDPYENLLSNYGKMLLPEVLYALSVEYLLLGQNEKAGMYFNEAVRLNANRSQIRWDVWNEERVSEKFSLEKKSA